ncbi:MAG: hypothetical protein ABS939_16525 [Psychrobacillus sp.]
MKYNLFCIRNEKGWEIGIDGHCFRSVDESDDIVYLVNEQVNKEYEQQLLF